MRLSSGGGIRESGRTHLLLPSVRRQHGPTHTHVSTLQSARRWAISRNPARPWTRTCSTVAAPPGQQGLGDRQVELRATREAPGTRG